MFCISAATGDAKPDGADERANGSQGAAMCCGQSLCAQRYRNGPTVSIAANASPLRSERRPLPNRPGTVSRPACPPVGRRAYRRLATEMHKRARIRENRRTAVPVRRNWYPRSGRPDLRDLLRRPPGHGLPDVDHHVLFAVLRAVQRWPAVPVPAGRRLRGIDSWQSEPQGTKHGVRETRQGSLPGGTGWLFSR